MFQWQIKNVRGHACGRCLDGNREDAEIYNVPLPHHRSSSISSIKISSTVTKEGTWTRLGLLKGAWMLM